jgi:hypothetical protein
VSLSFVTFGLRWNCRDLTRVTLRMTRGSPYSDVNQSNMDMWHTDESWAGDWVYRLTCGKVTRDADS